MAGKRVETPVTLTNDLARVLNSVKNITLSGDSDFITACNISLLILKHRQNKNQKQRIVLFVGSPIKHSSEDLVLLGKKLKKNNVAVDIISFGNVDQNRDLLKQFFDNVNNSNNSSLLEVPVGYYLVDSLFSSSIMNNDMQMNQMEQPVEQGGESQGAGNQGGMSQFEREIHMAIQASIEEEEKRKREQEANEKKVEESKQGETNITKSINDIEISNKDKNDHGMEVDTELEKTEKDKLLKNDDFIKDILEGIGTTDLNEDQINDVINQVKKSDEDKKEEGNEKENKDK